MRAATARNLGPAPDAPPSAAPDPRRRRPFVPQTDDPGPEEAF